MVEFILENETDEEISNEQIDELNRVCCEIMKNEECNFDAEISFTFTDNEGIREINREYRGIDRATDVLSFPLFDEDGLDGFVPEMECMLGDIVISVEHAMAQAKEFGGSAVKVTNGKR